MGPSDALDMFSNHFDHLNLYRRDFEKNQNFRFFEFFDLWVKKFSKIDYLQNRQKSSFFNICCFFVAFWAKLLKLPTFAQFCLPEISRGPGGTL